MKATTLERTLYKKGQDLPHRELVLQLLDKYWRQEGYENHSIYLQTYLSEKSIRNTPELTALLSACTWLGAPYKFEVKRDRWNIRYLRDGYMMYDFIISHRDEELDTPIFHKSHSKHLAKTKQEFNKIVSAWMQKVIDYLLDGYAVQMYGKLGYIYIDKYRPDITNWKQKRYLWDQKHFKETGEPRLKKLSHTRGYMFSFKHAPLYDSDKLYHRFKFLPQERLTRYLHQYIMDGNHHKLGKHEFTSANKRK